MRSPSGFLSVRSPTVTLSVRSPSVSYLCDRPLSLICAIAPCI
ncbi:MAG: hypothetical protein ACFE0J_19455 [Elainellaceae cyanobacterium]